MRCSFVVPLAYGVSFAKVTLCVTVELEAAKTTCLLRVSTSGRNEPRSIDRRGLALPHGTGS